MNRDTKLEVLAGDLLRTFGLKLAVVESCTGGLLGSTLTDVPGSSDYFLGGVMAYHDSVKTGLLGVDPAAIAKYGAVSAECALMMANGARRVIGSDIAISTTGILGPTGARPGKPLGTTYIALVGPGVERVEHFCWTGDRLDNKGQSVQAALSMLVNYLSRTDSQPQFATTERGAS